MRGPGQNTTVRPWRLQANGRRLALVTVLFVSLVAPGALFGDLLFLKSGEELEGFYVREVDGIVVFKLSDGTDREIASNEVERLQLGYSGVPLCYTTREAPDQKICDVLLHAIRGDELIIADQRGYIKLRSVPLNSVGSAELNRVGDFQKIAPLLKKNLRIRATRARPATTTTGDTATDPPGEKPENPTGESGAGPDSSENSATAEASEIVEGSVAEIRGDRVVIRDESGELREIEDGRIQLVAFQAPDPEPAPTPVEQTDEEREFRYRDLYPGVPQYGIGNRGKAYGMFAGFHLALLGVLIEFRSAEAASAAASADPTVYLFNNTSYLEQFEAHQRNQMILGGVAGLVYLWHVVDWFYFDNRTGPADAPGKAQPNQPAMLFDGYEYRDGEHREDVYRVGLQLAF